MKEVGYVDDGRGQGEDYSQEEEQTDLNSITVEGAAESSTD